MPFIGSKVLAGILSYLAGGSGSSYVGFTQSGTGAVTQTVQRKLRQGVCLDDFEVSAGVAVAGDGTQDDTVGVQAAFNSGADFVFGRAGATYKITNTVTIPPNVDFDRNGSAFTYAGSADRAAIVVGQAGIVHALRYYDISVSNVTVHDWSNPAYVGIQFINISTSEIHIFRSAGFSRGYELRATTGAFGRCAYNTIYVTDLNDNKEHEVFISDTPGAFVNENTIIGGRRGNSGSYPAALDVTGTLLTWDKVDGYRGQNKNLWLNPCYEVADGDVGTTRVPFKCDGAGGFNRVIHARHESGRGPFAICDGGGSAFVTGNVFGLGAQSGAAVVGGITETNSAIRNIVLSIYETRRAFEMWNSGHLGSLISPHSNNASYIRGDVGFFNNSATISKVMSHASNYDVREHDVWFAAGAAQGVNTILDTSKCKRFALRNDAPAGNGGRLQIQCFDASRVVLTSAGAGHPYVIGPSLGYSATNGGVYQTQSDVLGNEVYIHFGSDVAFSRIGFVGGTNPLILSSFSIMAVVDEPSMTSVSCGYHLVNDAGHNAIATVKPDVSTGRVFGHFAVGDTVFNGSAAVGQPSHWTCTTAGWRSVLWAINTVYAVGQIRQNGTNVYVVRVAGTSAGAGGPTGTGTGIVDNTVTWDFLAPVAVFATSPNLV